MFSLWLSAGPRAGRYGPEEQLCSWLVLLVTIHLALCSLLFRQAWMLDIMAGMNQKGFFKVVPRPIPMVFAAQADHGDSRRGAEAVPLQTVCRAKNIPLLITVIDDPVVQVVQVFIPVAALRLFPMVQTAVGP